MHRILDWARGLTVYWIRLLLLLLLPLLLWPLLLPPLFFLQSLRVPWAFYPLLLLLLAALLSCALLLPLPPLLTLPPVACVLVMYGCCSKVPVLRPIHTGTMCDPEDCLVKPIVAACQSSPARSLLVQERTKLLGRRQVDNPRISTTPHAVDEPKDS